MCFSLPSSNSDGGVLVHFWMLFVVPHIKSPVMCEECVSVIFRDSVQTSLKNRTSVGYLLNLPVDIDSILINGVSPVFFPPCVFKKRAESDCCVLLQLFSAQITHQTQQVGRKCFSYEWITVLCFSDWCPPPRPPLFLSQGHSV